MDTLSELLQRLGTGLADFVIFLVRLRESYLWQGITVNVTMKAGMSELRVIHGLGRRHQGAFVISSEQAASVFTRIAIDSETVTVFTAAPVATDLSFRLWVY